MSTSINKKNLNQSYFTPQGTRKRRINEAQSQQKECTNKNQSENKLETKKKLEKITETKRSFFEKIKLTNFQLDSSRKNRQDRNKIRKRKHYN